MYAYRMHVCALVGTSLSQYDAMYFGCDSGFV